MDRDNILRDILPEKNIRAPLFSAMDIYIYIALCDKTLPGEISSSWDLYAVLGEKFKV
jgi:dihydroxyacid dehydratase/phosphogluconate dehydratase